MTITRSRVGQWRAAIFALAMAGLCAGAPVPGTGDAPDVVVVGGGIAGLSAALELGRGGAKVTVVDMASVFGGHAVMAHGLINLVATPYQAARGIHDTPDLAFNDYVAWGEDANREWVRYYVDHAKEDIYDWLTQLGVTFDGVVRPQGNGVARVHEVHGRGVALVAPIYRECLDTPGITFRWNVRLDRLLRSGGRTSGVALTDLRTGVAFEVHATAVILATGGFQSNLAMVREAWPKDLPFPFRVLAGAGVNATGSGLDVARATGAAVERLDHQWNYLSGLPDPRFPGSNRGLFAAVPSVWVNADGKRFMAENSSPKYGMPVLLRQPGGTFWAVFGSGAEKSFAVSGTDWADFRKVDSLILRNPAVVKRAESLDALAALTGLPADALKQTVLRYNAMIARGIDDDFLAFSHGGAGPKPPMVLGPPYYAAQFFPITRKSMGGVVIDLSARVLDTDGHPIPGLYAAGELTGLAGINGKAGLEGTFLGPSLLTGRVAAQAVLREHGRPAHAAAPQRSPVEFIVARGTNKNPQSCTGCHTLPARGAPSRPGFWHFEKTHEVVLEQALNCVACHSEITGPPDSSGATRSNHRLNPFRQMQTCTTCHQGEAK